MESGKLIVYCGPMTAGKTTSLLNQVRKALEEEKKILVIKPEIDSRYALEDIKTHDGFSLKDVYSGKIHQLGIEDSISEELMDEVDIIFLDEIQFFKKIHLQLEEILLKGVSVFAFGLDQDSSGNPFGIMPFLLSMADKVEKLSSKCNICGKTATKTFRKQNIESNDQVLIGGAETYEPRCLFHWKNK
jgi:thymidine kinase